MLRRNFFTAAIGSVVALFAGKFGKAATANAPLDPYEAELAAARAANGGRLKTFADLDENTKWWKETQTPFDWRGDKCKFGLSVPATAVVYAKMFKDGDCVLVSTYIAPKGKDVNPRERAVILHAKASPAMHTHVIDVNGTLVRISIFGIIGVHGIGFDVVNGPSDSLKILSNEYQPDPPQPRPSIYRDLDGVVNATVEPTPTPWSIS